jgi:hypothetical protein
MERHWDTASNHEQSALTDEAVLALRQSFCDYLVSARKQRSMSIHEIAGVTRIPVRSLERLESGLFEELPADVFVRGFLRSYARCVGLDVEETIRRYTACGMTPAPVASAMADELASSMASLHEGGHPSVRHVTAPLPSQSMPDDGIGTSPGQPASRAVRSVTQAGPEARIDARTHAAHETSFVARRALTTPGHEAASPVPTEVSGPGAESVNAQGSSPLLALQALSQDDQPVDAPPARRKRRRRRRQRRDGAADAASVMNPGMASDVASGVGPVAAVSSSEARGADAGAASTSAVEVAPAATPDSGLSDEATVSEPAADASPGPAIAVASEAPRPRAERVSDTVSRPGRAATAAEHVTARPFTSRASTQAARTQPVVRGRASTVAARPVLVIDDAHPEEAERAQEERVERSDSSWRSLLPPSLLDSDDGSHRGTLTLAVIILVIVATLTMSYLLRRPNISGDGVTWNAPTALDEHRVG